MGVELVVKFPSMIGEMNYLLFYLAYKLVSLVPFL